MSDPYANRFDKVDLGHDKTMQRIIKAAHSVRNAQIEECAVIAESISPEAAKCIRALKELSE